MRTTMTVADDLMRRLKEAAAREGISLKSMIEKTLRSGLDRLGSAGNRKRYRCPTFALGTPGSGDLDKALALAARLEDDEIARKLEQRK